jgi:hypothetical protein
MNKDKDSSLFDSQKYKTLKYPKLISQVEELPKRILIIHLSRCMSQRNLPEEKCIEVKLTVSLRSCLDKKLFSTYSIKTYHISAYV